MNWLFKITSKGIVVAYHATNSGTNILQNGFQDVNTIKQKGLGGGEGSSFTTDWTIAKSIFDAFVVMYEFAQAPDKIQAMKSHFESLPGPVAGNILRVWQSLVGGDLREILEGKERKGLWGAGLKTYEELYQLGFEPIAESVIEGTDKFSEWYEPLNEAEKEGAAYSYVKAYFYADPDLINPVFMGSDLLHFTSISREDIGIFTVELNIDPSQKDLRWDEGGYTYLPGEAEYRIKDYTMIGKILDYDTNPGPSPKIQTLSTLYHKDEKVEQSVNKISQILMKHKIAIADIFDIDAGTIIARLHDSKDKIQLGRYIRDILKALSMPQTLIGLENRVHSAEGIQSTLQQLQPDEEVQKAINLMPSNMRTEFYKLTGDEEQYWDFQDKWYATDNGKNQREWYDQIMDANIGNIDRKLQYWISDRIGYKENLDRQLDLFSAINNMDVNKFRVYYDLLKVLYYVLKGLSN